MNVLINIAHSFFDRIAAFHAVSGGIDTDKSLYFPFMALAT